MNLLEIFAELDTISEELLESKDSAQNDSLDKAKAFISDYIAGKYWYLSPVEDLTSINTLQSILQISFYAPHLVAYHDNNKKDKDKINNLIALLHVFNCELFDKVNSLQYLYNAIIQEKVLLAAVPHLKRNPEATRANSSDDDKDYHYLVASDKKTGKADFIYTENIKVDAKIYKNLATSIASIKKDDSVAHDAVLLIIYLKDDNTWKLLVKSGEEWKYWPKAGINRPNATVQYINELAKIVYTLSPLKLWPS